MEGTIIVNSIAASCDLVSYMGRCGMYPMYPWGMIFLVNIILTRNKRTLFKVLGTRWHKKLCRSSRGFESWVCPYDFWGCLLLHQTPDSFSKNVPMFHLTCATWLMYCTWFHRTLSVYAWSCDLSVTSQVMPCFDIIGSFTGPWAPSACCIVLIRRPARASTIKTPQTRGWKDLMHW